MPLWNLLASKFISERRLTRLLIPFRERKSLAGARGWEKLREGSGCALLQEAETKGVPLWGDFRRRPLSAGGLRGFFLGQAAPAHNARLVSSGTTESRQWQMHGQKLPLLKSDGIRDAAATRHLDAAVCEI